jgi:hypothetical protein
MPQEILAATPAGHPRGQFPAEEQAETFRAAGIPVTVVQDLPGDRFLVVTSDEEAGVHAAQEELDQIGVFDQPDRDPRGRYVTVAYHLTVIPGTIVEAGDDATNAQWWPLSDLPPLAFDHADILRAAVESAS